MVMVRQSSGAVIATLLIAVAGVLSVLIYDPGAEMMIEHRVAHSAGLYEMEAISNLASLTNSRNGPLSRPDRAKALAKDISKDASLDSKPPHPGNADSR